MGDKITAEQLRARFHYDPNTGSFVRLVTCGGKIKNTIAGWTHNEGYIALRIDRVSYLAHRLAWLYVFGRWPIDQLDHINGNRSDNRIQNLRECSNAENCQNVKAHRDGAGKRGTTFDKRVGRWIASIGLDGKRYHIGYFDTQEQASSAYEAEKRRVHPFGASANNHKHKRV